MIKIFFQLTSEDANYLYRLKKVVGGRANGVISSKPFDTVTEIVLGAKEKGCSCIATTSSHLLRLLLGRDKASLNDYAGSIIEKYGFEFLILNPLEHTVTTSAGEFLLKRYIEKFTLPAKWLKIPEFTWSLFHEADTDRWIDCASECSFISCDIETGPENERIITCIGFSFVNLHSNGNYSISTLVVPFTSEYNVIFVKIILSLEQDKVFQNGKYDNAYLLRYNLPATNWSSDTAHMFHSWYSELPKRLDFITSFMLRKWEYWKDESQTTDLMDYYKYNAKDAFTTALVWLAILVEAPDWAWQNYYHQFPLVFPCLDCEMRGVKRDQKFFAEEDQRFLLRIEEGRKELAIMVGNPYFNPGSPKQTVALFEVLGSGDVKSSEPKDMDKVANRHPLNNILCEMITEQRKDRKLETSYLRDEIPANKGKDWLNQTKSWGGRILYSLNPHNTDTGRLASKESAFWCGWQFQNIPRDRDDIQIKKGIVPDADFYFGEGDYTQNEARGTAYLSGDAALIAAVDDETKDFHGSNASAFFGIPYNELITSYSDRRSADGNPIWKHKVLNKPIRDTSKRTNHGANYNMTAPTLLATMGIKNVLRAKRLLGLPQKLSLMKVCQYLLDRFDETYPVVRNTTDGFYAKIIRDIKTSSMLVGPTGWSRFCFGDPSSNKRDLNRYVAHAPQSLGAAQLNIAFLKVWKNIALPNPNDFKLHAQIHDSIFFAYRKSRPDLALRVKEEMSVPIEVTDIFGVTRTLRVPVDLKGEGENWADLKSLD